MEPKRDEHSFGIIASMAIKQKLLARIWSPGGPGQLPLTRHSKRGSHHEGRYCPFRRLGPRRDHDRGGVLGALSLPHVLRMLITLSVTLMLVIFCVILHYKALSVMRQAGDWLHRNYARHHWHLSILVCGLLVAHVIEVMLFGLAYCGLIDGNAYGATAGSQSIGLAECTYFSFSNYTSLGYGDLVPLGPLRFMAGMEALTGLVLITWTASFMYLQMQRIWDRDPS